MFNVLPQSLLNVIYPQLFAFDAGNGMCKGISGDTKELILFEPVVAPLTTQRALIGKDELPKFSVRYDDRVDVFGIDDVFEHGKRSAIRRLNSQERYTSTDYFHMIDVLFLHAFREHLNKDKPVLPTGVINVPIAQYNDNDVLAKMRAYLLNERTITNAAGDTLRIHVTEDRLLIVPESYGALMHYAYDPSTLKKRTDVDLVGSTLVVDIGYETTDMSLFEGLRYQRDRTESEPRAGMGIISRALQTYIRRAVRSADASRIDRAMQKLADIPHGELKEIEAVPGVLVDVTEVYEETIDDLAPRIAQEVLTRFPETVSRVLLAGGGAYHLASAMRQHLAPLEVVTAPNPELANVLGAFTMLNIQAISGRFLDQGDLV